MENITPTLILVWDVKRSLEKGQSVAMGIRVFMDRNIRHDFSFFVKKWFLNFQSEKEVMNSQHLNATRRHLLSLLEYGLRGQTILEALKSYETELIISCEDEIQNHVARLPLMLLVPLMGLIFPALMMLLIWPALKMFQL